MSEPTLREALERLSRDVKIYASSRALADLWPALQQADAALAERNLTRPRRADDGLDVDVLAEAAEKVGLRMAVEWWREVAAEYAAEQGEQR